MSYKNITINSEPETIEDFIKIRNEISLTPEGGAALLLLALKIYAENPDFGQQCLVVAVDMSELNSNKDVYKGYSLSNISLSRIKSQLSYHPYLPKSYIEGSNPQNSYTVSLPYNFYFKSNPYSGNESDGKIKIFVKCSGADSDRPITLYQNDKGIWKAKEYSSILVGIRKPEIQIEDDI